MSIYQVAIGTFDFKGSHGVLTGVFDSNDLSLTIDGTYNEEVNGGQLYYDQKRKVLYVCDETNGHIVKGGGGRIYAYRAKEGKLVLLNYIDTLLTKTCYCHLNHDGSYLMYANHTDRQIATKVRKKENGEFESVLISDDGGVGLISINEDGSLNKICDMVLYQGFVKDGKYRQPHCHSINSPDGKIFYTCDKGLDKIYSYKIDEEKGKIIQLAVKDMKEFTAPRYTAFHPRLPVMYENNETSNELFAFVYDKESGNLTEIDRQLLLTDPGIHMPSDLQVDHKGKYLFACTRNVNKLVSFAINEDGTLRKRRNMIPANMLCAVLVSLRMMSICLACHIKKILSSSMESKRMVILSC